MKHSTTTKLTIASTEIHQDADGRYSLNDLHKASGGEERHQPRYFLANQQTQDLITEISASTDGGIPLSVKRGGNNQGSYGAKELVYSYAMWISPKFHLQVIRTFDALVTGDVEKAKQLASGRTGSSLDSMRKQRAIELAINNADALQKRFPDIGGKALQCVYSTLVNDAAGALVLPAPSLGSEKLISATEVGKLLGVSANMVGRIATSHSIKTEEHGEWILGHAENNPSQRPTFVYNQAGIDKIRSLIHSANDNEERAA